LPLAFVIALLWTVHPLQAESVTYVVQRAESLMGLFYLLTLYCFVRGVESPRAWVWYLLSATACLLGMVTKETMVTAPLMVWLYDRTFVAGTFAGAWRQRWKVYAPLACTWLPLAWLVITVSWPGNATLTNSGLEGLSPVMKSYVYALKQSEAIVHYLYLVFWPHPLVSDYGIDVVTSPLSVAPQIALLAILLGCTLYALFRLPALGFLGAWFFVILAPTSSVVPLAGQTMAEHHMYLSLAAILVLMVLGLHLVLGRCVYAAGLALALGLGGVTHERNRDYHTNLSIWADAIAKRPDNGRAYDNLGMALIEADRPQEALGYYTALQRLDSGILGAGPETNLGNVLLRLGRFNEAIDHYQNTLRVNPNNWQAENNLGSALYHSGRSQEAIPHFLQAAKLNPGSALIEYNLGNAWLMINQPEQARTAFIAVLHLDPKYADAHNNLGNLYMRDFGQTDQAIAEYKAALQADPGHVSAHSGLANAYLQTNRPAEAIPHLEAVIRLKPDFGEAYLGLGDALVAVGRFNDAIPQYEAAVRLMPGNAAASDHLEKARQLLQSPPNGLKQ